METQRYYKYEQAVKQVRALKEFYQHLVVYVTVVIALLSFKARIIDFILAKTENVDIGFLEWLHINIDLIPFIWGAAIAIQALYVYRLKLLFFKGWEERKIQELIEKEYKNKTMNLE